MITTHILGYPRIGRRRELKFACERYWAGQATLDEWEAAGKTLRAEHWRAQQEAGIDLVPCNDFSFYDHVLDMTVALGAMPPRFQALHGRTEPEIYFAMARGWQKDGVDLVPLEMTKWFDTNYHYLVPEFHRAQAFAPNARKAVTEFREAQALGLKPKPVLLGPVSFLLLGKEKEDGFHRLDLLDRLLPTYIELLRELVSAGAEYVQLDEPLLVLDLDEPARAAYRRAYTELNAALPDLKIILVTYFEGLRDNTDLVVNLPVYALHLDLARAPEQLDDVLAAAPPELVLSLGVVDGRNVWKNDFARSLELVARAAARIGSEQLMLAPSCSLLHVPYDLEPETDSTRLPAAVREWLAFARQKLHEVKTIAALADPATHAGVADVLVENSIAAERRRASPLVHRPEVKARLQAVTPSHLKRNSPFAERSRAQQHSLKLPPLPATTIGSFPQTADLRKLRTRLQRNEISQDEYEAAIRREIERVIRWQEEIGMDVLVHGEPERNDMVQYFCEQLDGCAATQHGWVQSYGSRCVRPPIIYGDVNRKGPMTVRWSAYAQSLTDRPVKGMLTGPVTILQWSFVRDDQPRDETARQIAAAIRDEAQDLEAAGLRIIQIDEPALREGLPLRRAGRDAYLRWAVASFRLAAAGVRDDTQIHTHMCYSEFNDIIEHIAAMDADVVTIEASRSQMELLEAFRGFRYPNDIGPGVYDIHSPRVPGREEITARLRQALQYVSKERLWVNPDCGLKTRGWPEVRAALVNMVAAARDVRGGAEARR